MLRHLYLRGGAAIALGCAIGTGAAGHAIAATKTTRLDKLGELVAAQAHRLDDQDKRLADQQALIVSQQAELAALKQSQTEALASIRAAGPAPIIKLAQSDDPANQAREGNNLGPLPARPVGEAPTTEQKLAEVEAIPQGMGVLTPRHRLVLEPSLEYSRSSSNRLVFRGVEIVPGIQLGVIEANDADRDTAVGAVTARYGLTDRIELEARVPYIYRHDRVTTVAQRDNTISRTTDINGQDIGDVEVAGRYQINRGVTGGPVFVGNLRVKSDTGRGAYDVKFDDFGVATQLATGSGFWSVEPSMTMLLPADPAVIFANISYLHSFSRNIDRTIGGAFVGEVDPGDSYGLGLGFGLALNPRFSVSLGYSHNYIRPTEMEIGGGRQKSASLQVGAMTMGWSYRLREGLTLSNNFEFGVTSDAPDMRAVVRLPFYF